MTHAQQLSLLLYFESVAVDGRGVVNQVRMNDAERDQAEAWNKVGYVTYRRRPFDDIPMTTRVKQETHVVVLSDAAWKAAHAERRARAERHPPGGRE